MWAQGRSGASAIVHNDVPVDESDYLTFRFAELAADYVSTRAEEPFFLYLPFNAPHTPLQAPRAYYDRFADVPDPIRRTYCAMIPALDDAVGTVLDAVDQSGIAESTLIVFASDNGPLAGGKFSTFQGRLSVPLMMRYSGVIQPGTVYDRSVSLMDIFPTVAALSQPGTRRVGPPPGAEAGSVDRNASANRAVDGVTLMPYVLGTISADPHEAVFWRTGYSSAVPADHPEAVRRLHTRLEDWAAELSPPLWPPVMDIRLDIWNQSFWFEI